jgi:hypothetical protein
VVQPIEPVNFGPAISDRTVTSLLPLPMWVDPAHQDTSRLRPHDTKLLSCCVWSAHLGFVRLQVIQCGMLCVLPFPFAGADKWVFPVVILDEVRFRRDACD